MNKKRLFILGMIIFIACISSYIFLISTRNLNNKTSDESKSIITPKYDESSNNTKLYIEDILIEYENPPLYYDSYLKVDEETIIYNAIYENKITLDKVNVQDKSHSEITSLISSDYLYKGIFRYNDNLISLYYIDDDICSKEGEVGKIYYITIKNSEYKLLENTDILSREIFDNNFSYYCDFYN